MRQTTEQSEAMLLGGGIEKLESALNRPEQHAHYYDADIAHQAAVLAQGIVEAHAFRDGNKRVAYLSLSVFLAANGHGLDAPKRARAGWMIALATGTSADEIAAQIRETLIPLP